VFGQLAEVVEQCGKERSNADGEWCGACPWDTRQGCTEWFDALCDTDITTDMLRRAVWEFEHVRNGYVPARVLLRVM